jgi:pyruvate/2-oxoglutarate dehydrogenase complex dihydrolipoamide dehydrogenase (E3) component
MDESSGSGRQMTYDAIIIGSGQAGNPLSYKLADLGWRVALIEQRHLGGTCINEGCTPTKTMVASAQAAHFARRGAKWGVHTGNVRVDLSHVVDRKDTIVENFRSGQQRNVDRRPTLTLLRGHARFLAPRRLQIHDNVIEGERIFINTGTRPDIPAIQGLEQSGYLTNATLMELREIPEHLIVLGGGYIGLEFAQMFERFGSRVTVIHRSPLILSREDDDVSRELQRALESEGVQFELNATPVRVVRLNGRLVVTADSPAGRKEITSSHLLVATGRRPNTDALGLDEAGIETDKRGYIRVNSKLETSVPGVWALGDVKGGPMFTHISYHDYQIVFANLIEGKDLSIENRYVPYSVFTDPQLGRVGMTETQARASGRKLKIGTYPMAYVARAIERDETAGMMKIVVDAESDHILGAAVLGTEGGELIQILGALMLSGAPYTVLKGAVYIHPTLAEGFFGLMENVKPVD